MSGRVIKEGYLVKAPPLNAPFANFKWNKRYFRLFESGRLDYYSDETNPHDQDPKGIINLLDAGSIEAVGSFAGRPNCLRIITPQRLYIMSCPSKADMTAWRDKVLSTRDIALGVAASPAPLEQPAQAGADLERTHSQGATSAMATGGQASGLPVTPTNPTQASYVNVRDRDSANSTSASGTLPPPRNQVPISVSPQPPRHPKLKVKRVETFNGLPSSYGGSRPSRSSTENESNLDIGTRFSTSFDNATPGHYQNSPGTSRAPDSNGRKSTDGDGYCKMIRPNAGVPVTEEDEDEAYEEMSGINPPQAKVLANSSPQRPSPRPGRQSIATPFEVPKDYEGWDAHAQPIVHGGPPSVYKSQPPPRPSRSGLSQQSVRPTVTPRPEGMPRITPRGQSVR